MRRVRTALALWDWLNEAPLRAHQASGASRNRSLQGKSRIRARRAQHA